MTDASPSNNTGTYLNGVTLGVPGALNLDPDTAASFDGVNDIGRVPDWRRCTWAACSRWRVGSSVRSSSTVKTQELFNKGGNGFQMTVMSAGNGNEVWLRRANVTTIARLTAGVPADGRYHHVVATMNGSAPTIYVDGVPGTIVVSAVQTIQSTTFPIDVGGAGSAQANFDEFALYLCGCRARPR